METPVCCRTLAAFRRQHHKYLSLICCEVVMVEMVFLEEMVPVESQDHRVKWDHGDPLDQEVLELPTSDGARTLVQMLQELS